MATTIKKISKDKVFTKNDDGKVEEIEETPEARFQRLAQARTTAALKRISLIGNLGGPGYKSTEEQRKRIIDALHDAIERVNTKLTNEKAVVKVFTL